MVPPLGSQIAISRRLLDAWPDLTAATLAGAMAQLQAEMPGSHEGTVAFSWLIREPKTL